MLHKACLLDEEAKEVLAVFNKLKKSGTHLKQAMVVQTANDW